MAMGARKGLGDVGTWPVLGLAAEDESVGDSGEYGAARASEATPEGSDTQ